MDQRLLMRRLLALDALIPLFSTRNPLSGFNQSSGIEPGTYGFELVLHSACEEQLLNDFIAEDIRLFIDLIDKKFVFMLRFTRAGYKIK